VNKITYTTYVKVSGKDELCTVFNAEQLLRDIGWTDDGTADVAKYVEGKINSDKVILAAEDSNVAREVLTKFFQKTGLNYEIYNNGAELIERLDKVDHSKIGLILTDIEMPYADGYQVARVIKETSTLSHIPVIVNSSMTTEAVRTKMNKIGIDAFVGKTDIETLYTEIKRLLD
jgi:two-component system chemotaxis response regulator CheV